MKLCDDAVIELKNIRKTYDGDKYVLNGVNISLYKGDLAIIEGKSGSGKSTLMNIIGLLDDYNDGEYLFDGEPIKKKNFNHVRAEKIGFVFQAYHLIESISVKENIELPFLYNNKGFDANEKNYYYTIMREFGLSELEYKRAGLLSGGEKQRVAIARAIIKKPEIVIADEPTGNLDADNTKMVMECFRKLAKEGKVVIIVTHDINIAQKCDRRFYLKGGKLTE